MLCRLAGRFRRGEVAEGCAGGAEGRSKGLICLCGTWMEDTGGKSGRRPGSHLQVEASGPGNAASVQHRLAGRFRRGEVTEGCAGGAEGRSKRLICLRRTWMEDTGGKSGRRPGRHLQVEASAPGNAASVQHRLAGRFGGNLTRRNCCAGPGSKVDAPELSSGPGWEIQEVSRLGAQGVTSKSKLLARGMPRVWRRRDVRRLRVRRAGDGRVVR